MSFLVKAKGKLNGTTSMSKIFVIAVVGNGQKPRKLTAYKSNTLILPSASAAIAPLQGSTHAAMGLVFPDKTTPSNLKEFTGCSEVSKRLKQSTSDFPSVNIRPELVRENGNRGSLCAGATVFSTRTSGHGNGFLAGFNTSFSSTFSTYAFSAEISIDGP